MAVDDLDAAQRFYTEPSGGSPRGPATDASALGVAGGVGINLVV